ncbi:MAG: hypothetical protein IT305_13810 [Chloroflexi bacterium]|nr:hypothetical protein [Chloroflexota bacterium]
MRSRFVRLGCLCILMLVLAGPPPRPASACQPSIVATSTVVAQENGEVTALHVTLAATNAALVHNWLDRVQITERTNAIVEVDGVPLTGPGLPLAPRADTASFVVRKVTRGQPFLAQYVATDACGDMQRFIGAGTGQAGQSSARAPTPTTTRATATAAATATATPRATVAPPGTATPSATAAAPFAGGPAAVTAGTLTLTATFQSVGLEWTFTGDDDQNATAEVAFRRAVDSTWRKGLPLWRTDDGTLRAFYGSLLLLDPGTLYVVRVTLSDPSGVSGSKTVAEMVTTRADNVPPRSSLVPTYFVRMGGDDANAGTSRGAAWRTLDRAVRIAPAGAVVEVGPGYFDHPTKTRTLPLTLVAQYPAVDDNRVPISAGLRSVVENGPVSAPTGSDEPRAGVWQQVTLTGPGRGGAPAGASYTVWKWSDPALTKIRHLGYAATHDAMPERVAIWQKDAADLATPEGWAEKLFTNQTYNYGAYLSGQDLYLRLPPNAPSSNPNSLFVTAGSGVGLALHGADSRASGFEVRFSDYGIQFGPGANGIIDHNLLIGNRYGVGFKGGAVGPPSVYGADDVVEFNRIVDSNLWTDDRESRPAIPWIFIKDKIRNANGSHYGTSDIGAVSASSALSGSGTARRVVFRRNTIEGTFNAVGDGSNSSYDRYAAQDMDVHDNLIRHIPDDALEPEGTVINFRAWNNRIEQASTFLSTGPVNFGPIYLVRNDVWRIGNAGAGADNTGARGLGGRIFKYSGTSRPTARVFVLHNTIWTDQIDPNGIDGGGQSASSGPDTEAFYFRNNILRASKEIFEAPTGPGRWNEDYNHFSTGDPARGLKYGARYRTEVDEYRAASGQGAHTNVASDFITPPTLVNPTAGDMSLPPGSPLIDAGMQVPNISDRPGVDFSGAAPDLGARERP